MTLTLYGVTSDGTSVPIEVTDDGKLVIDATGNLWERDGTTLSPANDDDVVAVGELTDEGNGIVLNANGVLQQRRDSGSAYELFNGGSSNDDRTITLNTSGSANFAGDLKLGDWESFGTGLGSLIAGSGQINLNRVSNGTALQVASVGSPNPTIKLKADGSATFTGDVVIGSRSKTWLIRESNGVAMLIEQTRRGIREPRELGEPRELEKVRDLPNELDLVEAALNEVMSRLKMVPPAGWPVWDGQSEVTTDNDNA